jgi:hypothetical protein
MKKISLFVILGMVLFLLSGCFQSHRTIYLNKDGSGTIEETMLISASMGGFMGEEITFHDVEELKSKSADYGEGIKYVSSEEVTENGLGGYNVIYSFDDISKLKLDANATGEMLEMDEVAEVKEYITFEFNKGKTAELKVIFPAVDLESEEPELPDGEQWVDAEDEEDEMSTEDQDMAMQMAKSMYGNMEISTKIIVEGKITKTDATNVEENEVILNEIIFAEMLEDENALKIMNQSDDMDEGKLIEMIKDFPGVKMEMEDEISIKFK